MGRRRVPDYWWDFEWEGEKIARIHIQSDADYLPDPITTLAASEAGITAAEKIIADLRAGRADPRRLNK